jgi:predicted nucleic acid-binding protein
VLVDTNLLVYAYDLSEPAKRRRALDILDELARTGSGVVSSQVLAEFFVTVTRKLAQPLTVAAAYQRLERYLQSWTVVEVTGLVVLEAARGVRDYQFSFWDAQIWAIARLNQLPAVLSEDFSAGAVIEGVSFVNPFEASFRLADWLV